MLNYDDSSITITEIAAF